MSGKEQIKEGLSRSPVGVKPGFETRLTNVEGLAERTDEIVEGLSDDMMQLDFDVQDILAADAERAAKQDSAAQAVRNCAAAFALSSVAGLATLKAVGLIQITLMGVFTPALTVIAALALVTFMANRGYHWLAATFDAIFALTCALLVLAIIPVGIVATLIAFVVKPLRPMVKTLLEAITKRIRATSERTAAKLATT